jgi:hypothetical protein
MNHESKFRIGQPIVIDSKYHGVITAVIFYRTGLPYYEITYIQDGQQERPWIEEWRLSAP